MAITSYEVGAIFMIEDRATPVLERLSGVFATLDERINATQERLTALGRGGEGMFGGLLASIREIGSAIEGLGPKAAAAADAMEAAFRRGAAAATAAAREMAAATDEMTSAAGRMSGATGASSGGGGIYPRSFPVVPVIPFGGGGGGGTALIPGGGVGGGGNTGGFPALPLGGGGWTGGLPAPFFGYPMAGGGGGGGGAGGALPPPGGGFGGWTGYGGPGGGAGGAGGPPLAPLNYPGVPPSNPPSAGGIGMWEIGEALLGAREFRLAGEGDLALRQTLEALNIRPDDKTFDLNLMRMRRSSQEATDRSIISEPEGQKMLAHFAGIMIGSGEMGLGQVETLFPLAARLAELSHQRSGAPLASEAVAGGEFAHLTGTYDPDKMGPLLDLINAISQRTNTTIQGQFGIQRYGMPMAIGAGLTPQQAAIDIAFAELNMGATTRAGTAYGQFLTASMTGGEAKTIQQHAARRRVAREFEERMRLEDPEGLAQHQREMKEPKQLVAMENLGLVDRATKHHLNLTATGQLNEEFEKQKIREFARTHTDQQVESTLKDAFGQIGFRYAQIFTQPDALDRERMLKGQPYSGQGERMGVLGAPKVLEQQADLMRSPMQQFQQMIAQTDTILAGLVESTLPAFGRGLEGINTILGTSKDWLREHPSEQPGIATTLMGFIASGMGGAMNWMSRNASGMKGAAGRGIGGVLGTAGGLLTLFSGAGLAQDVLEWGSDSVMDSIYGKGWSEEHRKHLQEGNPFGANNNWGLLGRATAATPSAPTAGIGPRPGNLPGASAGPPQQNNKIDVHLGPVTMNGVPDESSLHALLRKMTDGIADALSHMSSQPAGTQMSPYTYPGL